MHIYKLIYKKRETHTHTKHILKTNRQIERYGERHTPLYEHIKLQAQTQIQTQTQKQKKKPAYIDTQNYTYIDVYIYINTYIHIYTYVHPQSYTKLST